MALTAQAQPNRQNTPMELSPESQSEKSAVSSSVRSRVLRRQQAKEDRLWQAQHLPDYTACQDMEPINLEDPRSNTEAGFCLWCESASLESAIQKPVQLALKTAFKEKLRKRVIGFIESGIFKIQVLRACFEKDTGRLKKQSALSQLDYPLLRAWCEGKVRELKPLIKNRWHDMRVSLSLASPALWTGEFSPHEPSSYMDPSPSHIVSGSLALLPSLNKAEKKAVQKRYTENILKAFKQNSGPLNIDRFLALLKAPLTEGKEKRKLKQAEHQLRWESEERYFQLIHDMPVLGFLEKDPADDKEVAKAYGKKEQTLKKLLATAQDPDVDMKWLISFRPLVEDMLTEDKGDKQSSQYCLTAETARIQAEKSKEREEDMLSFGILATIVPCFTPLSVGVCIAGGLATGVLEWRLADGKAKRSLHRALMGKELETLSELKGRQKELKMAKGLLPILLLEVGGIRGAVRGVVRGTLKAGEVSQKKPQQQQQQ